MKVVELDPEQVKSLVLAPTSVRAPGPAHVSNIIRDISNTVLKPGQREKYDDLSPAERQRMGNFTSVGWAWEQVIRRGMLDAGAGPRGYINDDERFQCPRPLHLDGIHGTPDWLDIVAWENVEFKATWRSSTRPLDPDFWEWTTQFKAYCKLLACTSTRLLVFYVNGDYRESGPQYKDIRIVFSQLEIEDNWEMLKLHAQAKGWIK